MVAGSHNACVEGIRPSWHERLRPPHSIDTRGNFGTSPSNGFWRCVAAPRSFGERRHKKRFRRLQRHAAAHPPRASNGLMVILDRPSMPPTFPVRPTNENDHSALDPPVKNRLSYFRGNNVPRHNDSDEQKE